MSTLKTGALRGTSGTADSVQLHASNQSVTFPGAVTFSGTVTGDNNTQDTGLPCFFATNESTGNWPASATPSRLDFSTTREDSGSDFSETAKFTPGTAGYYYVWCQVTMRFLDAAHAMQLYIYKNGSATGAMTYTNGRNSDYHNWVNQTVHGIVQCNGSSDYIEAYLANIPDSGTTTINIQHRNFGAFRLGPT